MKLGEKILKLRKQKGLSQEQLGEEINVTRQTISNWELGETLPNPEQLKLLSKMLDVSIDELLDNERKDELITKVSNTEKLAGIIIKILKFIGIAFLIFLVIDVIAFILFIFNHSTSEERKVTGKYYIVCNLDDKKYSYELEYNSNYQILYAGGDAYISNHTNVESYDDANKASAHVADWFKEHNGSCIINEE